MKPKTETPQQKVTRLQAELKTAQESNKKRLQADMSARGLLRVIEENKAQIAELTEDNLIAEKHLIELNKSASVPFKNVDLIERNLAEARKGI